MALHLDYHESMSSSFTFCIGFHPLQISYKIHSPFGQNSTTRKIAENVTILLPLVYMCMCVTIGNWIWANLKQKRCGKQWKGCILKDIWSVKRHQKGIEKGNFLHLKMDLNPILRQSETKIYKASNCEKAFNVMEEKVLTSLP